MINDDDVITLTFIYSTNECR